MESHKKYHHTDLEKIDVTETVPRNEFRRDLSKFINRLMAIGYKTEADIRNDSDYEIEVYL